MKKKLIRGLLGLVVFSNVIINVPILVYAEKMNNVVNASLDEAILDAVSDDFDDIDNPLAKELLFPVYCLGKNIDEIEKYVDFGNAKIKDRSDTLGKGGKQYTFSKDLSNYSDQTTGSEVWMFNDMGELDAIVVNFFNRSDATNIEVLDNMKKVFGDDCIENKDSQKGIDSYDWHKPDMGIVQVYNYTGNDSAKDDGINSLTITFLGEKFTDAYKESLNDNSNNSTTADADTIKKVQ